MEEASSSSDALQPQDLSSVCSLPDIECLLKANPMDGLRVVQTPAWFVAPGTSNGILLPESDSEPTIPAGQIQPDEAFSNTTVTLSYVSRSHLFSEHSPVCGVPSAFLRAYDAGKLATDAGDADCVQQVSVPLGLTTCEQLGFLTPAQVVENMAALCYLQQPDVENLALETLKSLQANPAECRFPISVDELQNGATNGLWSVSPFQGGFPEENGGDVEGLHPNANPELVFLISRSEEPLILPNEAASLAISLNPDFVSPLDSALPSEELTQDDCAFAQNATPPSGLMNDAMQKEEIEVMNSSSCVKLTKQTENGASDAFKTSDHSVTKNKQIPERKTLPPRAGRGMRLEAIVQNMQPFRCKSTRVVKPRGRNKPSRIKTHSASEEKTEVQHSHTEQTEVRRSSRRKDTISTSTPVETFLKCTEEKSSKRNFGLLTSNQVNKAAPKHNVSTKKSVKRNKKRRKTTSFFAPQEPEINLKCLKLKRKEVRDDTFAPYVRVQFSNCTIVNYPNEKRGKRKASAGFLSGIMPATAGFQYGRVCMDGEHQDFLVCCLCGSSSNAMDLGDLHGPYYAEGFKPTSKAASNHPEDENSDSDSSCRGNTAGGNWTNSSDWRWSGVGEPARRVGTDSPIDWYSPPLVPLHETEHWFHEDCAIWSAGVFLVRGKLYGLENAVKLAKVSVCSTCQRRGATLGCVYKGCLNKYHYTCAVQSGCVLNEDNYSMKCRKHKINR
ncbi:retinoic acid-induced protein 1 isoform X2 [Danio aesculapii]|uniref:retinoic acid-induced protein 1 isoform X2 n=1 Tax=Danio aesculapii TaxID=1142201 RepID=UPI0024BF4990|nr:retinoic acid-induced protein 1 isoform X2 [Danio aesculapii]